MTWELVLAFNVAAIAAWLSPGPAMLVAIQTSLVRGRKAGILIGIGLGFMASVWMLAAFLGLHIVFELFPWAYLAAKIAGAMYLLHIAWKTWRDADKPLAEKGAAKSNPVLSGILLNISNPKSVLFAAAVLVVIFPPDMTLAAKGFIVLNLFLLEITSYFILAHIMTTKAVRDGYLAIKKWFDRFAAIVLGGLAMRLLVQK